MLTLIDLVAAPQPDAPWAGGGASGQIASDLTFNTGAVVGVVLFVVWIIGTTFGIRMLANAHKGDTKGDTNRSISAAMAFAWIAVSTVVGAGALIGLFGNAILGLFGSSR